MIARLLAGWRGVALGALLLAVAAGALWLYGESRYRAGERAADERHALTQAEARAAAEQAARGEERRRALELEEIQRNAQTDIDAARRDAAAAAAVADRLRSEVARLRAERPASDPATAGGRPAGADALDLLAELLSRADDRAGDLAAIADRARVAGMACERAYDALHDGLSR